MRFWKLRRRTTCLSWKIARIRMVHAGVTRALGVLGNIGSFSFQQSKGMTGGEGGILTTNDEELAYKIYGLKNCGRPWRDGRAGFGGNYRITEFQAAVLLPQLARFEKQLDTKNENLKIVREKLRKVPGITILEPKPKVTRQGLYGFGVRFDPEAFGGLPQDIVINAIKAEGVPIQAPYNIVYKSGLWTPGEKLVNFGKGVNAAEKLGLNSSCPVAERISYKEGLVMLHHMFLGTPADMEDIVAAFEKVQKNASELRFRSAGKISERRGQIVSQESWIWFMSTPMPEIQERTFATLLKRRMDQKLKKPANPAQANGTKPVSVGLIGAGNFARWSYVPRLKRGFPFKLAAVFDVNQEGAKEVADSLGAKAYASVNDLLKDEAVEAVFVCTPVKHHYDAVFAALQAKKHVLCEKPLGYDYQGSQGALRRSAKSGEAAHGAFLSSFHSCIGVRGGFDSCRCDWTGLSCGRHLLTRLLVY